MGLLNSFLPGGGEFAHQKSAPGGGGGDSKMRVLAQTTTFTTLWHANAVGEN